MARPKIHPSAIVDPEAALDDDVEIGPHALVEGAVRLGAGTRVRANAVVMAGTTLGPRCDVFPGAVVGAPSQGRHAKGEAGLLICGAENVFRESVTINAGSPGSVTRIGERNLFMACSHVGHDCTIGNDVTIANGALVAGHVVIEDKAILAGNSGVQQFCRVGTLAMVGGNSAIPKDLPPFLIAVGHHPTFVLGPNVVGLRRAGIPPERRLAVKRAFKILYLGRMPLAEALAILEKESAPEVKRIVEFVKTSKRGIFRRARIRNATLEPSELEM